MNDKKIPIEGVIFDMDGLMLDTESVSMACWKKAGIDCDCEISDELCYAMIGTSVLDANKLLFEKFGSYELMHRLRARREVHIQEVNRSGSIKVKEGLFPLLDYLDAAGVLRAVATSSDRVSSEQKLAIAGLKDRFSVVVTSSDVKQGKPHPDIFLKAAAGIKVSPDRCLVLEDSARGMEAAASAGMSAILVPDIKVPSDEIRSLSLIEAKTLSDVQLYLISSGRIGIMSEAV